MENNNKIIESNYNALLVVRAKNALFNAGFDGLPRTLPEGTIYATDKALKYCIREFLALFKELPVFVRRNRQIRNIKGKTKLVYDTLEENFVNKAKSLKEKGIINDELKKIPKDDKQTLDILKKFIDVRLFGIVFSAIKNQNISLTGPVQISYGVNKFEYGTPYNNDILSPYAKDKGDVQTTIGNETRTDEVYYVYDISINKNNAQGEMGTGMTMSDLQIFKESLMKCVDLISSTTKFGVESVALLWFKNPNNIVFNNLSDFVEIRKGKGKEIIVDFTKVQDHLENIEDFETENKKVKLKLKEEDSKGKNNEN